MKIAILTGPFFSIPPAPCGAVERIWHDLASSFVEDGHEVTVYTRYHPKLEGANLPFNVVHLSQWKSGELKWNLLKDFIYSVHALIKMKPAEILVTNTFWLPILKTLRPACFKVVHVHIARVPKGQYAIYTKVSQDRFAAVSRAIAHWVVKEAPGARELTKVFANPIDTRYFNFQETIGASSSDHRKTVVYTGRIHSEKGLDVLAKAGSELADKIKIEMIGPWKIEEGGAGKAFVEKLRHLAGDCELTFREAIYDREKLAQAIAEGDLYCYPSLAIKGEASPVAPLEAMALGMPTIVSALPQFRDYLKDDFNGFVYNHRPENRHHYLAETINKVLSMSKPELQTIRMNAGKTGEKYTVKKVARRYLADFERLLEKKS